MIMVTGAAGSIGSNFVLNWCARSDEPVINFDKFSYAGNLENLASLQDNSGHVFVRGNLADRAFEDVLLAQHSIALPHFGEEGHVDRSIDGPEDFVQTNIVDTFRLLEAVSAYKDAEGKVFTESDYFD